jgi:hypothetical protein
MNIKDCQVYWASDLKSYGFTEDGEDFIGEVFSVYIENPNGDRWVLGQHWDGVRKEASEWGTAFIDIRPEVRTLLDALVVTIRAVNEINMARWSESRPAYGSRAYMDYGQAEDLAWERDQG